MNKRQSFLMHYRYLDSFEELTAEETRAVLLAMFEYSMTGSVTEPLDRIEALAFKIIQSQMDADDKKYIDTCERNKKVANNRYDNTPNSTTKHQNSPELPIKDKDKDKDIKESTLKGTKEKRKRFVPPTREDVIVYRSEKGLDNLDVDKFIDYYTSNGWMIGKNHMKDWKSCARNWNRNEDKYQRQGITAKGTQRFNNFDGRQYSGADMNEFERMLLAKKN